MYCIAVQKCFFAHCTRALHYAFRCLFYYIIYNRWRTLMGMNAFFWQPAMFSYISLVIMLSCCCVCISCHFCYLFGKIKFLLLLFLLLLLLFVYLGRSVDLSVTKYPPKSHTAVSSTSALGLWSQISAIQASRVPPRQNPGSAHRFREQLTLLQKVPLQRKG